jgi:AcrR family transcriptional regulator
MPTKRFDTLEPDRKAQLLDAAAAEFSAHGYEAASFNRIIERAGTSKGAIYYYFEDKADLYATVVQDAVTRFVAYCGPPEPVTDAASFWESIGRLSRASIRYYRKDPHIAGIIRSIGRDGLKVAPVAQIRTLTTAWFAALLHSGQQVGAIRTDLPLDLMLGIAIGVSDGFDLWLADHAERLSEPELERLGDEITNLYRRMATPEEPR